MWLPLLEKTTFPEFFLSCGKAIQRWQTYLANNLLTAIQVSANRQNLLLALKYFMQLSETSSETIFQT